MSDLKARKATPEATLEAPARAVARTEFEKLLHLGNGQFECDNRREALSYYNRAWKLFRRASRAGDESLAAPAEVIFLCRRIGEAHQVRAEYDEARAALAEAERRLDQHPDDAELGQVLAIRGSIATDIGRFSQAQRLLKRAHDLLKHSGDHHAFGVLERRLGKLYLRMGRPQEARNYFENALATFRRIGDQRGIAGTLNNLGLIHKLACEWTEAIRVMEKGLALNEILQDEAQIGAPLYINLGVVHLKLGQWKRAEECLERAIASNGRIGNRRGLANAFIARANLAIRQRQWNAAETWLGEALEIARAHGLVRAEGLVRESLGDMAFDRGDYDRAEAELTAGLELARELGATNELVGELGRRLGEVYASTGRLDEALDLAKEAIHIQRKVGDLYEEALCHRLLARIHGLKGELKSFKHHAGQVIDRLSHMGERWEQSRSFLAIGDVWMQMDAKLDARWMEEAQAAYQRAETLALGLEMRVMAALAALRLAALDRVQGRLDQALVRIGSALSEVGEEEVTIRQALVGLRGEVEDAIAAGYGPKAAEREAFQEVTKLYSGRAEVADVLTGLLRLVEQRSGSNRAFFAWGPPHGGLSVRSALSFRRGEATRILNGLGREFVAELVSGDRPLIATEPKEDPRLAAIERPDTAPPALSVAVLPFRIPEQVRGLVYVERSVDNDAGPYRAAEIALLAMLTNVVAIAAVESERVRKSSQGSKTEDQSPALSKIVTCNPDMLRVLKLIERVSETPARVLLLGETGTGKGLIAGALHEMSPRSNEPFVQLNCAAMPEPLLESELFGHVHGAFTGAIRDKAGLFEEAGAGTIFLDEIDKMSGAMQAKLLHVLDRQEVRKVGDTKWRKIHSRVICAANVDLRELIRKGEFLEDLYYRLNEFSVVVPPLRERPDDILLLARHFIEESSSRMGRRPGGLTPDVERIFVSHEWPGNVRELQKTIERVMVLATDDAPLGLDLLPEVLVKPGEGFKSGTTLREEIRRLEARLIGQALRENGWNKLRTARSLRLSYPALLKKIREYNLDRRKNGQPATKSKNVYI